MPSLKNNGNDERLNHLRLKIKKWEHEFASKNGGVKPSQSDIRNDLRIASKYREYYKLRHLKPSTKPQNDASQNSGHCAEPLSKLSEEPVNKEGSERPESFRKFLNIESVKATPQKNGKVLGIFDSLTYAAETIRLSVDPGSLCGTERATELISTPSKSAARPNCMVDNAAHEDSMTTPSKKRKRTNDNDSTGISAPNFFLDEYSTPKALRHDRLQHSTYSTSPEASLCLPKILPRKPPLKGLTSILAELRNAEDRAFADDEEALHDAQTKEANADELSTPKDPAERDEGQDRQTRKADDITEKKDDCPSVPDLAQNAASLGPSNSKDSIRSGIVPWKKKGLKRQTKRAILRPIPSSTHETTSLDAEVADVKRRKIKAIANFKKLKLKGTGNLRQRWLRGRRSN